MSVCKEQETQKPDDDQEPGCGAESLQFEELDISSYFDKIKSKRTSVVSETSSARRVRHLQLKALKEQKEIQICSEKLRRKAEQSKIADL